VERELCGAAEDLDGLLGVGHAGQFDDDPPLARAGDLRLAHAELVDPAPEHLQSLVGGFGVGLGQLPVSGLEHDLGAAAQVQAEVRRSGGHEPPRDRENREGEDRAHGGSARHGY
jgi:hypothetical protein